ncbi:MAG: hypothetical protein H6698_02690 [Myxococcales bacterium]|nr:hypothetical protein [Myxococcales bacterium]MCB9519872.1 hypothetical protein [Myxococcales bacterium]MCB9532318.1 hypothetical protein [Myxococcales bacterium]MCB9533221.1 hypothetical protein [Myxococcales bacterium]
MLQKRLLPAALVALAFQACGDDQPTIIINPLDGGSDATGDVSGEDTLPGDVDLDVDPGETGADAEDGGVDGDTGTPTDEICDDGADNDGDGDTDCDDADCAADDACADTCGNGELDRGEECDDGNTAADDGCSPVCEVESGFVNRCGDGVAVAVAGEQCDDGDANSDTAPDACRTNCLEASCGDGVVDTGEDCDGGEHCLSTCETEPFCGDGEVDAGEECDDGNDNPDDDCDACHLTENPCGDGVFSPGTEQCDAGFGCLIGQTCVECLCVGEPAECGNGTVEGTEECDGADDGACIGEETCARDCRCVGPTCGNNTIEGSEECDGTAGSCGVDAHCVGCACEPYECGNGTQEGTEECDGTDGDCGADAACNGDCECQDFVCGNGVREGTEACDGSATPCGTDFACTGTCTCRRFVCGDGVREGSEVCDGSDAAACTGGMVCNGSCACERPVGTAPTLNPISATALTDSTPTATLTPWGTGTCDAAAPHGLDVVLSGTCSAPITSATVRITGLDTTARTIPVTPSAVGTFSVHVPVCMTQIPENASIRFTVVDSSGRSSSGVNWTLPRLRAATLTSMAVFTARDTNTHMLRLIGVAPDRNVAELTLDIFDGTATEVATDFTVGVNTPVFSGDNYYTTAGVSGVDGIGIARYDGSLLTFGGLASTVVSANVRTTPTSGQDCIPVGLARMPICSAGLVCRRTTNSAIGTCQSPTGSTPTLSSLTTPVNVSGAAECSVDFPNLLGFTVSGSSSEAIVAITITAAEFGTDPIELGTQILGPGAFTDEISFCFSGSAPASLSVRLVDEGGRQSTARTITY